MSVMPQMSVKLGLIYALVSQETWDLGTPGGDKAYDHNEVNRDCSSFKMLQNKGIEYRKHPSLNGKMAGLS